jgi:hypothetical protein
MHLFPPSFAFIRVLQLLTDSLDPISHNVAYHFQTGVYSGPGWIQTCGNNLLWWMATTRDGKRKNVGCVALGREHGPYDKSED